MKQIDENGFTVKWSGDDVVFDFLLGICSEYEHCVKAFRPTEKTAFRTFTRFAQSEGAKGLFTAKLIADADLVIINKAIYDRGLFVGDSGGHIVLTKENHYKADDKGNLVPASFGDQDSFRPTVVIFHSKDYTWINQIFEEYGIKIYGDGNGKVSGEETVREVPNFSSIPQAIEVKMEQKEFSVQKSCYEILEFLYGREVKKDEETKTLPGANKPSIRGRIQFIKEEKRRQEEEKQRQREAMMNKMYGSKRNS